MAGAVQHIHASRFHLQLFAENGQVLRVSRSGYARRYPPTAVGYVENELTDDNAPPSDRFWPEQVLGDHENRIAPKIKTTLGEINSGQTPSGRRGRKAAFTEYLAIQLCRSKSQREWITQILEGHPDLRDSLASARADSLLDLAFEIDSLYPASFFFRCERPIAHPELPFVVIPDGSGVMLAMDPRVVFVQSMQVFTHDSAGRLYWEALRLMETPFEAVLCAPSDAESIRAEFCGAPAA